MNYVGYYSQHEETMKTVIQNQAQSGEEKVKDIFEGAMVDCRRDQLWQKLLIDRGSGTVPNLSHLEFLELISLVHHETLDKVDTEGLTDDDSKIWCFSSTPDWPRWSRRAPAGTWAWPRSSRTSTESSADSSLQRTVRWVTLTVRTSLLTVLRQVHHTVVIHQENLALFALLSVDSVEGSLAIVHRDLQPNSKQKEEMAQSLQALLEGFVEACAFHAWSLLL